MFLKNAAKSLFPLLLTNILIGIQVFSQTTPLTFTSIPIADPDLNAPGRGVEQWHDRNDVNVPTEGVNTQRLDVYQRFVWTRIEGPTLGSYNWSFFDGLVNDAITKKQKFSFGIMTLYPGGTVQNGLVSFDGGVASYPLYLHTLMQAETVKDWRTGTIWTPNYNSIHYQDRLLALNQAIDAHIKTTSFNGVNYKDVINCIDIRGYGAWGEWHSGYTPNNVISDYPAGTFPTVATLKKIVDAHTQGFPDFPLVAMIAAFDANWLQNTRNPPEIAHYVLTQRNNWGLIGWRRDQWGATDQYLHDYLENNNRTFGGIVFKDSIMVRWKSAPITGEPPAWSPNAYTDLEAQVRLYHAASFGNGNYGTTLTTQIKGRVRAASKACGYRVILEGGNVTLNGNNLTVALNWKNIGQAPTYENWNVEFELKNSNNQTVWSGQSQFKPKLFLPSATATIVTDNFTALPVGTFNLNIIIKDPNGYRDPLPLAITGRNADGSYPLKQQITIQSPVPPPNVAITNNCGSSVLTASGYTGTLLWSTGENTPSITVTVPGLYTVTQTVSGMTSSFGSATAAPKAIPSAPGIAVVNNCGNSLLTATDVTGTLLWSTNETTGSITVATAGTYTVTQTVNACIGAPGSAIVSPSPFSNVPAPAINAVNNCGNSLLTATGDPGAAFLWSTGATTTNITVTANGTYTVKQTVNNCTSPDGSITTSFPMIPALSGSLTATATSSSAFSYTATSGTPGTTFAWSRAVVTGISNAAANGNGNISETLVNITTSPVNVTYVFTLTAGGCTNTQNVVVTVGVDGSIVAPAVTTQPSSQAKCAGLDVIFGSAASGGPAPTVQWQVSTNGTSWNNITGATASTLSFTTTGGDNNKQYRAVWTNIAGTATSNAALLTVSTIPAAPGISVTDNCGSSLLTATGAPGASFSWSNGASGNSITVTAGTYTVTQTVNGCTGPSSANATAAPKSIPAAPDVSVVDNCGSSLLTATGAPGASFSWSNGATNNSITVPAGTYTVSQIVNNCTGPLASATASPKPIPALSGSLTATATSSGAFSYTATSGTPGTTFAWSRAAVTGISNVADNGNGNINETLVNTTASPVSVTYVYTLTANGCTNTQNVVVTVGVDGSIVAPAVTTQPATQSICVGVNANFSSAASGSPAPTVQWQESTNGNSWHNITGATNSTLSFTTTAPDNNNQYRAVWTNIAGTATSNAALLTVNTIPAAPGISVADNCGSSLLTATGAPGASFSWSTGAISNSITVPAGTYTVTQTVNSCTGPLASATAAPKSIPAAPDVSVVDNCGTSLLTATGAPGASFSWSNGATGNSITMPAGTYTVSQIVNNCTGPLASATASPKPIPALSGSLTATATSSGAFSYTATSGTPGTTFAWSRAAVTGISNVADNGNGNINETLVNTTASPVSVTYVYTLTANGCTNTQNVVVTVGVDGSIVAPAITTHPSSQTICAGLDVIFSSDASGSPAPTVQWQESTNGTTWNDIPGATVGAISFTTTAADNNKRYRAVWTSMAGTATSNAALLTVNTIPAAPGISVADNCGSSLLTATGASGASFSWSTGAISNSITVPGGTYTVTQTVNGCTGPSSSGTAAPKSIPSAPDVSVVDNCGTSLLTATGAPGASFSWSNGATDNSIMVPAGTYTVSQIVNTCTGPLASATASPKPILALSSSLTATATSSSLFSYTATSNTLGTTFAWSRAAVAGISNVADNGNGNINETLVNTTASPVNVTYVYTLTANECTNTQNVVVTVGVDGSIVAPAMTTQPASQTRCAGVNVIFSSDASGSPAPTVQWQESTNGTSWNNIAGATTSTLSFTTTAADNNKQYRAVWTNMAGTATSNAALLTVNTIPASPGVSVTDNCGSSMLTATGAPGASFSWSTGAISNSITVLAGTYTVTQTVNNCTSAEGSGVAAPKPIPALSSSLIATATSSSAFSYTATSSTPGTTFAWSRAAVTGITNAGANGNGNINETLVNITASPVNVTYVYTLTANGCTNTQNVVVTVGVDGSIISPAMTAQPAAQTRCAGVNASFSSGASGSPAPTVQWQVSTNGTSWNNITGATANPLSFTTTAADNNKQYRAVWTNIAGSATSNAALLTVNTIPNAPGVSVTNNCSSSLLTVTGAPGATFLWSTGATTSSITVTTPATYTVTQTVNSCSSPAGSGVAAPKPIPALSSSLTATATSGIAFTYTATSSTSGTTFAWSRATVTGISNAAANGNGNINETLVNTTASSVNVTYVYTLTANGCTNTQNVVVTVGTSAVAPVLTTQPASQPRCAGANASFSSAASGTPAPTVQWQVSTNGTTWTNITGATTGTLSFATAIADNNKQYRAVWTNIAGTVNSNAATLTVNSIPAAPGVSVTNNCGNSLLTATGAPGATFSWSTGATTSSITVTTSATFTVTQTVNSCSSPAGSGAAAPKPIPALSSSLTATATTGTAFAYTATSSTPGTTFAWSRATVTGISNAAGNGTGNINETLVNTTASAVNVTYVYTLTANGCTNAQNVVVTVSASTVAPVVTTQPTSQTRCAGSNASFSSAASGVPAPTVQWQVSTNSGFTWSNITGATTSTLSFATTTADNNKRYRARWTNALGAVNSSSATLTVSAIPSAPTVSVTNNCGNSVLTATGTGSLLWSTGATTSSITVTTAGTYTVTRTVNGCASPAASGVAAPRALPVLSSNLSASVTTGNAFTYTPTSTTVGTTFAWSRAAITGISNSAASGTGSISETLTNTTALPVNVTYVYTLTGNGCTNTQNLVVTVNPIKCVINGSITSSFTSTSIPAGRFIWFSSVLDRGSLTGVSGTVTVNITNSRITFTANSQQYTLNVPNARIRFDDAVTSATTQFVNNVWETAVPRSYTDFAFMGGLAFQVPVNFPGSISNVNWSATISIDKVGVSAAWKWAAAVYTSLGAHSVLNIKPKNGTTQSSYPNNDLAGTPENYKSFVVSGAKGSGGTNYTGSYSSTSTAVTCSTSLGQRPAEPAPVITEQLIVKDIPALHIDLSEGEKLEATAAPNPTSTSFNLVIKGNRKSLVSVKVIDISGRVVERYEKVPANHLLKVGQRLAAGSYFLEVIQDDQKKIIRVIKVN